MSDNKFLNTSQLFTYSVHPPYKGTDGTWQPLVIDIIYYAQSNPADEDHVILITEWDFEAIANDEGDLPPIIVNLHAANDSVDLSKVVVKFDGFYKGAVVPMEPVEDEIDAILNDGKVINFRQAA